MLVSFWLRVNWGCFVSASAERRTWLGGYIREGKKGPTYILERWIAGKHWHLSTKCRTERAALKELERFEASPLDYKPGRQRRSVGLEMTPELVDEYVRWVKAKGRHPQYVGEQDRYNGQLMTKLGGRDFRRLKLSDIVEAIDSFGASARPNRIAAIKAFASWLRREKGLLTRAEDPTLDLKNIRNTPERFRRRKAMTLSTVQKVIPLLGEEVGDVAIVLAATGLHLSELQRLHEGKGGLYEPAAWQKPKGVIVNVQVAHKGGKFHVVALTDPAAVAALHRVLARKRFPPRSTIHLKTKQASEKVGEKYSIGWNRHSVATWLALGDVPEEDIAKQLGHASTKMARSVYIDLGQSAHPVPIPRLKLAKG